EAVLDELIDRGDVTEGPGGRLAAAPLRAVWLRPGHLVLFGTIPTCLLTTAPPPAHWTAGVGRSVSAPSEIDLAEAITSLNGLVVSAERWSGLDRAPAAGADWLAELDGWLAQGAESPEALQSGVAGPWQAYRPGAG